MERFWSKVKKLEPKDCWTWLAATNYQGYGIFRSKTGSRLAHRISYELLRGPIPQGLQLDHLCKNPSCINPYHLEPVTRRENMLRGGGLFSARARATHCMHGHPFNKENTYLSPNKTRKCKTCRQLALQKYRGEEI